MHEVVFLWWSSCCKITDQRVNLLINHPQITLDCQSLRTEDAAICISPLSFTIIGSIEISCPEHALGSALGVAPGVLSHSLSCSNIKSEREPGIKRDFAEELMRGPESPLHSENIRKEIRQTGQVECCRSHLPMHATWNAWPHPGRSRRTSFFL